MQKWTIKLAAKDLREASSRQKGLLTTKAQKCFNARHGSHPDAHRHMPLSQMWESFATNSPIETALKRLEQMNQLDAAELNLIWMRADKLSWKVIVADKEFQCSRTTAWRRWKLVLNKICEYLNGQQRQQEVEHDAR